MLAYDWGPHEETEKLNNETKIITYHEYEDCSDEDVGNKNRGIWFGDEFINYMKIKTYDKNEKLISTEKKKHIIPKSVTDEIAKIAKKLVKDEEEIFKETGKRINLL